MLNWLLNLRNQVDYRLRQLIKLRRPGIAVKNQPKIDLFNHLKPAEREKAEALRAKLESSYRLQYLANHSSRDYYRENLYYLHLFQTAFSQNLPAFPEKLNAADIGTSHWFYIQAYHAFLKWHGVNKARNIHITGYEIDPYRVYADFYSRTDHLEANIRNLEDDVTFIPRAFETKPDTFHYISLLFPFVLIDDHLQWGLIKRDFQPQVLLSQVWKSLTPNGALLIVNQGKKEFSAQLNYLKTVIGEAGEHYTFAFSSPFYTYEIERFGLVVKKHG